jgi:hypothetical protein
MGVRMRVPAAMLLTGWSVSAALGPASSAEALARSAVRATQAASVQAAVTAPSVGRTAAQQAAAERTLVRWYGLYDPRWAVRTAAWTALLSSNVDDAMARFFATELPYAIKLSKENSAVYGDFARRILDTHTEEFAPEVHAAAERAVYGLPSEQEWFAVTGYGAALERDRRARAATQERADALVKADRDFVALLGKNDPGAQVRAAARRAVRPEATEADLVEFFAYDWVAAASLDLYTYRIRQADSNVLWRARTERLVREASAAQKAALQAAGEAQAQARAAAARAWHAVGVQTGSARTAWAKAATVARKQAANWESIAAVAGASTGPNWQVMAESADDNGTQWAAERKNAAEQAAYWKSLYDQALQSELAMQDPPAPSPTA